MNKLISSWRWNFALWRINYWERPDTLGAFWLALKTWLAQHPRRDPCPQCGRLVWYSGEVGPVYCSKECIDRSYYNDEYEVPF